MSCLLPRRGHSRSPVKCHQWDRAPPHPRELFAYSCCYLQKRLLIRLIICRIYTRVCREEARISLTFKHPHRRNGERREEYGGKSRLLMDPDVCNKRRNVSSTRPVNKMLYETFHFPIPLSRNLINSLICLVIKFRQQAVFPPP